MLEVRSLCILQRSYHPAFCCQNVSGGKKEVSQIQGKRGIDALNFNFKCILTRASLGPSLQPTRVMALRSNRSCLFLHSG